MIFDKTVTIRVPTAFNSYGEATTVTDTSVKAAITTIRKSILKDETKGRRRFDIECFVEPKDIAGLGIFDNKDLRLIYGGATYEPASIDPSGHWLPSGEPRYYRITGYKVVES